MQLEQGIVVNISCVDGLNIVCLEQCSLGGEYQMSHYIESISKQGCSGDNHLKLKLEQTSCGAMDFGKMEMLTGGSGLCGSVAGCHIIFCVMFRMYESSHQLSNHSVKCSLQW